jgi:hypothetical protein
MNNTRQTSIDCYNQIKAEGLLSKRRFEVYEKLLNHAPCTASEAVTWGGVVTGSQGISSRFTELRDLGVIYEKQVRACKITGRNVIEYDITGNLPIKQEVKKITKKQRTEQALDQLRLLYKKKENADNQDWICLADLIKEI